MSQWLLFDMASNLCIFRQSDIEKRTSISDTHMHGRMNERVKVKSTLLRWIIVWFIKSSDMKWEARRQKQKQTHTLGAQGADLTSSYFVVNHWLFHFRNTFGIQSDSSSNGSSIFVWSSSSLSTCFKEINSYSHSVVCLICVIFVSINWLLLCFFSSSVLSMCSHLLCQIKQFLMCGVCDAVMIHSVANFSHLMLVWISITCKKHNNIKRWRVVHRKWWCRLKWAKNPNESTHNQCKLNIKRR